jgi:hypothetical protein
VPGHTVRCLPVPMPPSQQRANMLVGRDVFRLKSRYLG